jgi:hypothetical protein
MEVASLLAQLQKALTKPEKETCSVQTQTRESYMDESDLGKTTWDIYLDSFQAELENTRDAKRQKTDRKQAYPQMRTVPIKEPVRTPEPLTLQLPPSNPSVATFTTDQAHFSDNISDTFDENDLMDPEEEEVVYQPPTRSNLSSKEKEIAKVFDEDSSIISRKGGIFCISSYGSNGMTFHDTIRKPSETWKEAEERHRLKSHPIIKKRAKLMSILSEQEKKPMSEIMKKYSGVTTMELFCRIKQESPALLKPLATE